MRRLRLSTGAIILIVLAFALGLGLGALHPAEVGRWGAALGSAGCAFAPRTTAETGGVSLETAKPSDRVQTEPASILFVGDVLPVSDQRYFERIKPLLQSADFVVGNLECPISTRGERTDLKLSAANRALPDEYFFRAPPSQAQRLADAGFSAVTLANNHIMDFGEPALKETLSLLDEAGIKYTGAGSDRRSARQPIFATANGQTLAVLAYVDADTLPATTDFAAGESSAGTVFVHGDGAGQPDAQTTQLLREDISRAARRADIVVACFHWGAEGKDSPDPLQRNLAHLAIDAGAELVVGHHPHVLQGVEIYRGRPIAYSLGNFAFPTPWANNQFTAALEVRVEDGGWAKLAWHPVRIAHRTGIPAPAEGRDAGRITSRLNRLSHALGTSYEAGQSETAALWLDRADIEGRPDRQTPSEDDFRASPHRELDGMVTVSFLAWDLDGDRKVTRRRTVVVAQELADEVLAIFREIYEDDERFPIHEVIGYDYRTVAGSGDRLSWHARGRAIDINRAENPMIEDGETIVHPDEPPYAPGEWRPDENVYSIPADGSVVRAFTSRGWRWGGRWTSVKDYQHFDRPR